MRVSLFLRRKVCGMRWWQCADSDVLHWRRRVVMWSQDGNSEAGAIPYLTVCTCGSLGMEHLRPCDGLCAPANWTNQSRLRTPHLHPLSSASAAPQSIPPPPPLRSPLVSPQTLLPTTHCLPTLCWLMSQVHATSTAVIPMSHTTYATPCKSEYEDHGKATSKRQGIKCKNVNNK